jgi:hypothetical protein
MALRTSAALPATRTSRAERRSFERYACNGRPLLSWLPAPPFPATSLAIRLAQCSMSAVTERKAIPIRRACNVMLVTRLINSGEVSAGRCRPRPKHPDG